MSNHVPFSKKKMILIINILQLTEYLRATTITLIKNNSLPIWRHVVKRRNLVVSDEISTGSISSMWLDFLKIMAYPQSVIPDLIRYHILK